MTDAPGWPGIPPRWTSSAKSGVGTALSPVSRVWFTLSHGILDEIYYPRVDQACTRDFGMIVTGADGLFAEEKRDCRCEIAGLEDGVPAFRLINTHTGGRFRIIKDILSDPRRFVLPERVDRAYAICYSLAGAVINHNTPARWEAAMIALGVASRRNADIPAAAARTLCDRRHRPEGLTRLPDECRPFYELIKLAKLVPTG